MAMVSSTTPRFGPMCPPVLATLRINRSRISSASSESCGTDNALMSAGETIFVRKSLMLLVLGRRCRAIGTKTVAARFHALKVYSFCELLFYRLDNGGGR